MYYVKLIRCLIIVEKLNDFRIMLLYRIINTIIIVYLYLRYVVVSRDNVQVTSLLGVIKISFSLLSTICHNIFKLLK